MSDTLSNAVSSELQFIRFHGATMSDSQLELLESSFESLVGADDDVEDMIADTPLVVPLENSSDGEDDDGEESGGSDSD
ncbi:hypothetical protein Y032_0066g3693 [Ancylostoma ceylanicum]|uniref:Uncharacterized protein n=1 Tax=Ancylostoma ceylanicum TaxID=53326 RepID=A0A016TZ09_9BILA|nr:hypothetical protein Y032_0066g3693 [Ancylostoma ceylanicum]